MHGHVRLRIDIGDFVEAVSSEETDSRLRHIYEFGRRFSKETILKLLHLPVSKILAIVKCEKFAASSLEMCCLS